MSSPSLRAPQEATCVREPSVLLRFAANEAEKANREEHDGEEGAFERRTRRRGTASAQRRCSGGSSSLLAPSCAACRCGSLRAPPPAGTYPSPG
eukprot:684790-Prorocentrum_minimum.AAC.1